MQKIYDTTFSQNLFKKSLFTCHPGIDQDHSSSKRFQEGFRSSRNDTTIKTLKIGFKVFIIFFLMMLFVDLQNVHAQADSSSDSGSDQLVSPTCNTGYAFASNTNTVCCPTGNPYYCGDGADESLGECAATQASCFGQTGAYDGPCNAGNTCNDPSLTCDTSAGKCLVAANNSCVAYGTSYQCASSLNCNPNSFNQSACCPGTEVWDGNAQSCSATKPTAAGQSPSAPTGPSASANSPKTPTPTPTIPPAVCKCGDITTTTLIAGQPFQVTAGGMVIGNPASASIKDMTVSLTKSDGTVVSTSGPLPATQTTSGDYNVTWNSTLPANIDPSQQYQISFQNIDCQQNQTTATNPLADVSVSNSGQNQNIFEMILNFVTGLFSEKSVSQPATQPQQPVPTKPTILNDQNSLHLGTLQPATTSYGVDSNMCKTIMIQFPAGTAQ